MCCISLLSLFWFLSVFTDIRNISNIIAVAGIFVGNISVVVIVETIGAMIGTALGSLSTLMSGKK